MFAGTPNVGLAVGQVVVHHDAVAARRLSCSTRIGSSATTRCSPPRRGRARIITHSTNAWPSSVPEDLERRHRVADLMMRHQGITFTVYGRDQGRRADHALRPDPAPHRRRRVGPHRTRPDAARPRPEPLRPRRLPRPRSSSRTGSCLPSWSSAPRATAARCAASACRRDIYLHISGIDLIRDPDGQFLVLEDNCRTPVGRQLRPQEPRGR